MRQGHILTRCFALAYSTWWHSSPKILRIYISGTVDISSLSGRGVSSIMVKVSDDRRDRLPHKRWLL